MAEASAAITADGRLGSMSSRRSWTSAGSFREIWTAQSDVFNQSKRRNESDYEEDLRWAAIQRIPTFERLRKGVIKQVLDDGRMVHNEVDFTKLEILEKKQIVETLLKSVEEDNEKFLQRLKDRFDRYLF